MPQSLVRNYIHLVFSTKNRESFIYPPYEEELYAYLGDCCNELGCQSIIVGGYTDHVHLLFQLTQKLPLMEVVQKVKSRSSKWIKTKSEELESFYWQKGYGAFSVSHKHIDATIKYISEQHKHHGKQGFQDEFRLLLDKHNVPYNEKYVWD